MFILLPKRRFVEEWSMSVSALGVISGIIALTQCVKINNAVFFLNFLLNSGHLWSPAFASLYICAVTVSLLVESALVLYLNNLSSYHLYLDLTFVCLGWLATQRMLTSIIISSKINGTPSCRFAIPNCCHVLFPSPFRMSEWYRTLTIEVGS